MIIAKQNFIKNPIYVSYTGLSDFLKCPRSYYFKNIYKDPRQNFKIQIISPHLVLGSTVHDAIKWYLEMKGQVTKGQFEEKFRNLWLKYQGKRGGFVSREEEVSFGKRGLKMLSNFIDNAKVLEPAAPTITFPKYNLVEDVLLIGNFDFVGEASDGSLHVIDFKTGAHDEDSAMQLYIYAILAEANFGKKVSKASFWYLDRDSEPREIVLDPLEGQLEWLKEKSLDLKKAIKENSWVCIKGDPSTPLRPIQQVQGKQAQGRSGQCRDCTDYQAILDGKGEFLFSDYRYKKEIYYLKK